MYFAFRLFRLHKHHKNNLIDLFAAFECPVYDVSQAERYGLEEGPIRNLQQVYAFARFDYLRNRRDYAYENVPEHNRYLMERGWWDELPTEGWIRC